MDTLWFYAKNGQQLGPVGHSEMREMASSGRLDRADLVWRAGMANWQPAATVPELFSDVAPAAAASPVPPPVPARPAAAIPVEYYVPRGGPAPLGEDAGMRWLLPVGRSGWAIAAGYLGLLSVLLLPAPIALVLSILAVWDIRNHPHRHGMGRAIFGMVMGTLGSVGLALVILHRFA